MIRRLLVLALLSALLLIAAAVSAQEATEAPALPDLGGREITVAVENAYPPYNFINPAGEAVGWDYDTFRDICRLINCVPVFVETAWDGMLVAIANGEFDVAADGITYTADRDETVDFSQLYQAYDETLLIKSDETRFATVAELLALPDIWSAPRSAPPMSSRRRRSSATASTASIRSAPPFRRWSTATSMPWSSTARPRKATSRRRAA